MPVSQSEKYFNKAGFFDIIINKKFSQPLVVIFLLLASLSISFLVAKGGMLVGILLLLVIIGVPVIYASIAYPEFGIIVLITIAFWINFFSRFLPEVTPLGIVMDFFDYIMILGFFIKQQKEKRWDYFNNPISYFILLWLIYNLFEVINPAAASMLAWVYTVRSIAFIMLMYYVFVFQIRSKNLIKIILKLWLLFALIGAISAFWQENIGFFKFESEWLTADPLRISLLFINGHMRKFGIYADPVVFAFNTVAAVLLCIALLTMDLKLYKKVIIVLLICFFLNVLLYSGTRSSYVLIPAAMIMLTLLKMNKRILIIISAAGLMLGFLIKVPTSNISLVRFQTAFRPSKDASFDVRAQNQKRIRPYILSHPMGGGLGSVGVWGERFSPNSFLAKFPPDSGYVRVAVETGWLGLLIYCLLNFVILYKGIDYFYRIRDPELKAYCLAMILIIFAFDIGNYPQQAFVQYPSNIMFFLATAILVITIRLDKNQQEQNYPKLPAKS